MYSIEYPTQYFAILLPVKSLAVSPKMSAAKTNRLESPNMIIYRG